ncbi:transglutaminase domain-containing protein [Microbacterium rhizomatis]|uniref:Transglutaminase domain-containing protein n=1 Tax=Microbacterium rhizomatis TaxID=1631477 RepID=A0A5J5J4P3_9MICO|nr:transglutaminase domain-containing protein [Microbacterium rhizomatis]
MTAGAVYIGAMVALAALAAWPIYRSGSFVLLVIVSAVAAALLAVAAHWRQWSAGASAASVAVAFVVLGVPLAVPSRLGSPVGFLSGLADLAAGTVLAWKDLVTVDLPVGSYRNLLVPALVVFLVGTYAALRLSWREGRGSAASVAVAIGMLSFGLLFGRTTVSDSLHLGPLVLFAPVETALGVAGLVASVLWLAWRSRDQRVRSLHRAAASRAVRVARDSSRTGRRRAVAGAGMLVAAVVVALAVVPIAAQGRERDVLRAGIGPDVMLSRAVSPLVGYRALFADARADDPVFSVSSQGAGPAPDRIRVATLDGYDGEEFRSTGEGDARFVRVPSRLDAGPGAASTIEVTIGALSGVWLPTAGRVVAIDFGGPRAAALADRFYYSAAAEAGVQTADGGVQAGDTYVVHAVQPAAVDISTIEPGATDPGTIVGVDEPAAPPHLRAWVKEHAEGSGGAALVGLVTLLRERGYLSHGLTSTAGVEPVWAQSLDGYVFQPSAAGHSLARIDGMFSRLQEREADPRAAASGNFVAPVGDDEQFSVAVALIARELGFPSRVVVGARLSSPDPDLAVCAQGVCRGQDLSAWTEVRAADGTWVPIDATPQHRVSPSLEVTQQRDPEIVTDVRPDAVTDVVPPASPPQDTANADPAASDALDLTWLWVSLRALAVALLILAIILGPFAVVIAAKRLRRRARREHPDPASRIAGGWEEYLDAAADAGRSIPPSSTRPEIADALATPSGATLAAVADDAAFSGRGASVREAEEYWRDVDADRAAFTTGSGVWRRVLAAVSLRSFLRVLTPGPAERRRARPIIERGRRRSTAGVARPSI